jgi:P-type E1-E2 ATPase
LSESDLLRLAGAVEQGSGHLLARTVAEAAQVAGVALPPADVTEFPGRGVVGVVGVVDGKQVLVGARSFLLERYTNTAPEIAALDARTDGLRAWIAVDGTPAGVLEYADRLRPGAREAIAQLRELGVTRLLVRSGDTASHTTAIATAVGITDARGDLLPEHKVDAIRELVDAGERLVMVGDGTNDAPALGTASVGIALACHGGGITAEAADVVVLADDLDRVVTAIRIARRTLRIARQSIWVGLGLSGVAMGFAAGGMIPPITGALLQEVIDVAVILNALRASRAPGGDALVAARSLQRA